MTLANLLHRIHQVVIQWLLDRLTYPLSLPHPTTEPIFDFEDFEDFDDLPPPPASAPSEPCPHNSVHSHALAAAVQPIYVLMPKALQTGHLTDLHALAIVDPDEAEAMRWRILRSMQIEQRSPMTPLDAWLERARQMSNNPEITLEMLHAQPLSSRARGWIQYLVGVDANPQQLDCVPEIER